MFSRKSFKKETVLLNIWIARIHNRMGKILSSVPAGLMAPDPAVLHDLEARTGELIIEAGST